jgi:hypothetical protein
MFPPVTSSLSFFYDLPIAEVQLSFTLETKGHQHVQEILRSLAENGFHLITP